MDLVNRFNDQFIASRVGSRKGVTCDGQSGGGFGATSESLAASATGGLGKGHPSPIKYTQCDKQSGGGHNYDADGEGFSYGYTKEGATVANELKGSYAPISVNKKTNMCGGKRKRKRKTRKRKKSKKKRRRKNKTKKSKRRKRTKRKTKRRRKYRRKRGGSCSRFKRKTKRTRRTKRFRGGAYSQYMSNVPDTPSYSTPNPSKLPWATGPGSFNRQINCKDNYNHYKN
jgi:hypothetical protein